MGALDPMPRERRLTNAARRIVRAVWYGARKIGITLPETVFLRSPVEQRVARDFERPGRKTVLAVVDFATFPLSFDVLNLMAVAELYRRRIAADAVDLACVCDWSEPVFGHDRKDASGDPVSQETLIHNLCLEGARLLPHPGSIHFFTDRVEFERYLASRPGQTSFVPQGYSPRGPSYISRRGAPPVYGMRSLVDGSYSTDEDPLLRPDEDSVNLVRRWLDALPPATGPTISITVRDYTRSPARNSATGEWRKLIESYGSSGIRFVIVPDYFKLFQPTGLEAPGVTVFEAAALSLGLRSALYRSADLNLFVGNGPATIAYIDHAVRFLTFKMVTDEPSSSLEEIEFQHTLGPENPLPWFGSDRAIVWEDDTFETMRRTLDQWLADR